MRRGIGRPTLIAVSAAIVLSACGQAGESAIPTDAGDCQWVTTTLDPDGNAPPCPTPEADDLTRIAAFEILGEERFAGLWYENGGTELVLGYVGDQPNIADIPGVDRLESRARSLADLQAEAVSRNATGDGQLFWRVDAAKGIVESIPREPESEWDGAPGPDL